MTIREAQIISVYTGVTLFDGEDIHFVYEYASRLIGRPIYSHEFVTLRDELHERSKLDFLAICSGIKEDVRRQRKSIIEDNNA